MTAIYHGLKNIDRSGKLYLCCVVLVLVLVLFIRFYLRETCLDYTMPLPEEIMFVVV